MEIMGSSGEFFSRGAGGAGCRKERKEYGRKWNRHRGEKGVRSAEQTGEYNLNQLQRNII